MICTKQILEPINRSLLQLYRSNFNTEYNDDTMICSDWAKFDFQIGGKQHGAKYKIYFIHTLTL